MNEKTIKLFGSKKTDNWQTPPELYEKLNKEFKFNLDPCPLKPKVDGLGIDWKGNIFVNPPYSKVKKWLRKAHYELSKGNSKTIVFLVFANTDTNWFHSYIYGKAEIRFLRGRLRFLDEDGNKRSSAMRPSMLAIFQRPPHD